MAWAHAECGFNKVHKETLAEFFRKILRKKDFMITVVGEKGSGKSLTVGSLCEMIDPTFCRADVISDINNLKTRLREKIEIGNDIGVMNLDDFGSELDPNEFLSDMAKETSHLIQKSRTFHVGFFITVPDRALINKTMRDRLSNYFIEVVGHNEDNGYATIKMFRIDVNKRTGKVYHHRLCRAPNGEITARRKKGYTPINAFMIKKPSKHFMDWYVPFRTELALKELEIREPKQITHKNQLGFKIEDIVKDSEMVLAEGDKYVKITRFGTPKLKAEMLMSEFGYTQSRLTALEDYMNTNKMFESYTKRSEEQIQKETQNRAIDKTAVIKEFVDKIQANRERYIKVWSNREVLNKELVQLDLGVGNKKILMVDTYMRTNGMLNEVERVKPKKIKPENNSPTRRNQTVEERVGDYVKKILGNKERYIKTYYGREVLNIGNIKLDMNIGSSRLSMIDSYMKDNNLLKG